MGTSHYLAKLKARLDQALVQRDHWRQIAAAGNVVHVAHLLPDGLARTLPFNAKDVGHLLVQIDALRAELEETRESMAFRGSLVGRLEAERDQLRAENAASLRVGQQLLDTIERQDCELEAARALLRELHGVMAHYFPGHNPPAHEALMTRVAAFLAATPAPEARRALCECNRGRLPCTCKPDPAKT